MKTKSTRIHFLQKTFRNFWKKVPGTTKTSCKDICLSAQNRARRNAGEHIKKNRVTINRETNVLLMRKET